MSDTTNNLEAVVKSIYDLSLPRDFDWITLGVSLIALVFTIYVVIKQLKISKQQASISAKQNKIALFELRYSIYDKYLKIRQDFSLQSLKYKKFGLDKMCLSTPNPKMSLFHMILSTLSSEEGEAIIMKYLIETNTTNVRENTLDFEKDITKELAVFSDCFDKISLLFELRAKEMAAVRKINFLMADIIKFGFNSDYFNKSHEDLLVTFDELVELICSDSLNRGLQQQITIGDIL